MDEPETVPPEELLAHAIFVRGLARSLLEANDAEDVEQDTWATALEYPPLAGPDLHGWLARVSDRLARRRRRGEARRKVYERAGAKQEAQPSFEEDLAREELSQRVIEAVRGLEEPYRRTILARFHEGLTPVAIAARERVSVRTVDVRLYRGLARLRARLQRERRDWRSTLAVLAGDALQERRGPARRALERARRAGPFMAFCILVGWCVFLVVTTDRPSAATERHAAVALREDRFALRSPLDLEPARRESVMPHALLLATALSMATTPQGSLPPLPCSLVRLVPADSASMQGLGGVVAIAGELAILGAENDDSFDPGNTAANSGAVYVFRRDGQSWVPEQKIVPADTALEQRFGSAVATDGQRLLAAAHTYAEDPAPKPVYVFRRDGECWVEEARLLPAEVVPTDGFGNAVALDGDIAVVGAFGHNLAGFGKVYVFERSGSDWGAPRLIPAHVAEGDRQFGYSVSVSGHRLAIGSKATPAQISWGGAVYAYRRDMTGAWVAEGPALKSPDVGQYFGNSIALDGDWLVVGAPFYGGSNEGRAYVYEHDANGTPELEDDRWVHRQTLAPTHATAQTEFGTVVDLEGAMLVVGASAHDHWEPHPYLDGAAYVFERDAADAWQTGGELFLPLELASAGAAFGGSVGISGSLALIGCPGEDGATTLDAGSAHVFDASGAACMDSLSLLTLSTVTPPHGRRRGGNGVVLFGTGFTLDTAVAFGGVPAIETVFLGPTMLSCMVPAQPDPASLPRPSLRTLRRAVVDVTVSNACSSVTLEDAYTYDPVVPQTPR